MKTRRIVLVFCLMLLGLLSKGQEYFYYGKLPFTLEEEGWGCLFFESPANMWDCSEKPSAVGRLVVRVLYEGNFDKAYRVLSSTESGVYETHAVDLTSHYALMLEYETYWVEVGITEIHRFDNIYSPSSGESTFSCSSPLKLVIYDDAEGKLLLKDEPVEISWFYSLFDPSLESWTAFRKIDGVDVNLTMTEDLFNTLRGNDKAVKQIKLYYQIDALLDKYRPKQYKSNTVIYTFAECSPGLKGVEVTPPSCSYSTDYNIKVNFDAPLPIGHTLFMSIYDADNPTFIHSETATAFAADNSYTWKNKLGALPLNKNYYIRYQTRPANESENPASLIQSSRFRLETPTPIVFELIDFKHISCKGASDGEITFSVSGGIPPYKYRLASGDWQPVTLPQNMRLVGLKAESYIIRVKDSRGCSPME